MIKPTLKFFFTTVRNI